MSNEKERITSKLTRLANPPLSPVKTLRRVPISRQNVRILEGSISGFPFLLADFRRRLFKVSRDAVVWKRFSGSLETLITEWWSTKAWSGAFSLKDVHILMCVRHLILMYMKGAYPLPWTISPSTPVTTPMSARRRCSTQQYRFDTSITCLPDHLQYSWLTLIIIASPAVFLTIHLVIASRTQSSWSCKTKEFTIRIRGGSIQKDNDHWHFKQCRVLFHNYNPSG